VGLFRNAIDLRIEKDTKTDCYFALTIQEKNVCVSKLTNVQMA